jgi:hypothetical protein
MVLLTVTVRRWPVGPKHVVNRRKVLSNKGSPNQLVAPRRNNNPLSRMSHSLLSCGKWWRVGYCCGQDFRLSEVTHSDNLDSDQLTTNHFPLAGSCRNLSNSVEDLTDWERFQNLASNLFHLQSKWTRVGKPIKRPATLVLLQLRRTGYWQTKLHSRTSIRFYLVWSVC